MITKGWLASHSWLPNYIHILLREEGLIVVLDFIGFRPARVGMLWRNTLHHDGLRSKELSFPLCPYPSYHGEVLTTFRVSLLPTANTLCKTSPRYSQRCTSHIFLIIRNRAKSMMKINHCESILCHLNTQVLRVLAYPTPFFHSWPPKGHVHPTLQKPFNPRVPWSLHSSNNVQKS